MIVRMDNMAVVSYINSQGGSRSRTLDRLARHLLLWSQDKFLSLRAVHVLGVLNLAVLRFCLFEPAVFAVWFVNGPDRAKFLAWHIWYIVPKACKLYVTLSEPMKENVSDYLRNPCSL